MNVNGVTNSDAASTYKKYRTADTKKEAATTEASKTVTATEIEDTGVVYEASTEAKKYTPNTALVNQLKADAEQRTAQFRTLVEQLMSKQSNAYGTANDMWKFLASGDYTVNAQTKAQAQKDIAEDGYWGVAQTSDRILDFATALTGGDPDKIEEMRNAFKKGYKQAEKTWGGKLPELSQKTYDAVMEKFDKLAADAGLTSEAYKK